MPLQFREVYFVKTVVFSAVNIFPLEKCFKTKTRLCQKCSSCRNSMYLLFDFVWYTEILHFVPGNILEQCLMHGIRIGVSATAYYLLLKKPQFNIWYEKRVLSFRKIYTFNKFSSSKETDWEWILPLMLLPTFLLWDMWTKHFTHVGIFVFLLI